jgi:hypothetical protein
MDDKWLGRALVWAADRVDGLPTLELARKDINARDFGRKARASVVLAQESFATEHRRHAARWQLGNACRTFSGEAEQTGDADARRDWLVVGCLLFADLAASDPRYAPSLRFCADGLRELGIEDWNAADPVPTEVDVGVLVGVTGAATLSAATHSTAGDVPTNGGGLAPASPEQAPPEPDPDPPDAAPAGIDPETGRDYDVERLVATWTGPLPLESVPRQMLDQFLVGEFRKWPVLFGALRSTLEADIEQLEAKLPGVGLQKVGEDVLERAREARGLATAQGVTPRTEAAVRQRWLLAAAVNFALWEDLDWGTNRSQVMLDLLGYVTAVQISRRFSDEDRELLLASHELVVQVGASLPKAFHRFPFVRTWITSAFGTYLLLGGPQPAIPSESLTDDRILGERRTAVAPERGFYEPGREERQRWAQLLLRLWRYDAEVRPSAAFAVASVCGWDATIAERMLGLVFSERGGEAEDDRTFWRQQAEEVVRRAQPIRIASNPWAPTGASRSGSGIVTTDKATGRLFVPDAVLKAMVSQVVADEDASVTVLGEVFNGRRVPTYLLINQFGAFGVVKLDFADRVAREKRNFDNYARPRLRPHHRPSECRAGSYRLYVGEEDEPLQALLTSYVFEDDERPATLAAWLREVPLDSVQPFFDEHLADRVIYPWLSQARRDVIDIRMPYPVLRPHPAEPGEFAPSFWAQTELARITNRHVTEGLGAAALERQGLLHVRDFTEASEQLREFLGVAPRGTAETTVNPLWMAAELAELPGSQGTFDERLYNSPPAPLSAFNTLLTINHGDFHADNILCTDPTRRVPKAVLIDFETTHETHLCRDFSRLEASILCQVFDWAPTQADMVLQWQTETFADRAALLYEPPSPKFKDPEVQRALVSTLALRRIVVSCGQPRWPLRYEEYGLALLAALLPLVRNTNTMNERQRALALLLAAQLATHLERALLQPAEEGA